MVSLKRNAADDTGKACQRIKPTSITMTPLRVSNVKSGEAVHQQCLLLKGECPTFDNSDNDYISVKTSDSMKTAESSHNWPTYQGQWKALVLLAPGNNTITVSLHHAGGTQSTCSVLLVYQPLLQIPPLHLAIMVAKDSPLVIDCPPAKYGAISSAHNSLDAVIAKFRMTAYMWQALTAEDVREKELGRRTFRFEEEWTADTTSFQTFRTNAEGAVVMKSLPKVHIVRTEKTVAELRDAQIAQQNPGARRPHELHEIFTRALKAHGGPFESTCRPVVAGLILDSCYSLDQNLILGHAALGCHQRSGLSLGMFGSHLTYSWPRSMEEVSSCLLDATPPGDSVGNDNGECDTMARACFIGQGAFLHEVGHAFGADHTEGIMKRGYSKGWGSEFLDHQSLAKWSKNHTQNDLAKWALQDVLRFKTMPHFQIPGDEVLTKEFINAEIQVKVDIDDDDETQWLCITSAAGLQHVKIQNGSHIIGQDAPASYRLCDFRTSDISELDRNTPLEVTVLAQNGKPRTIKNAWTLFRDRTFIHIPGTSVRLQKMSVKSSRLEEDEGNDPEAFIPWTVLLNKPDRNGTLVSASSIDLRVGCTFDGAVVYYPDGTYAHCGPTHRHGSDHNFGGHASENSNLSPKSEIVKVEVNKSGSWGRGSLDGIRMTLDNGAQWGCINDEYSGENAIHVFQPSAGQKIVGFFGKHEKNGFTEEFGILTAPEGFVIPEEAYGLEGLRNNLVQVRRV